MRIQCVQNRFGRWERAVGDVIDRIIQIFVFGTLGASVVWFLWLRSVATNDTKIIEQKEDKVLEKQDT